MTFKDRFRGRTAIVAGGASGIGLDIATRLAAEGAQVCLWDLKEDALAQVRAQSGAVATHALDIVDVNLNGLFYCNRAAVPPMERNGYGRIVNIASIAGKEGNPNASAYSASKAAVIGLTKSLGKELAKDGVTVNAVTPATIDTPILEQVTPAFIAYMRSKIPMERFGTVDEAASLVCWLASRECSFSTGAVFDLSGGRATY